MRGKGNEIVAYIITDRITPAYAGKRKERTGSITQSMDHPRLCGEKRNCDMNRLLFRGSPPPMRGKAVTHGIITKVYGITPAYAGKRRCGQHSGLSLQDHPRLCGEKFTTAWFSYVTSGSPPPMRGKATNPTGALNTDRITPAYAGKSFNSISS